MGHEKGVAGKFRQVKRGYEVEEAIRMTQAKILSFLSSLY